MPADSSARRTSTRARCARYSAVALLSDWGSASAAAKLRQQGPSLMAELQRRGWPVTGLRVRPQPLGGIAPVPVAPPRPPMPASAVAAFAELERDAPEGALKEALAELLRHARQPRR